MGPGRHDMVELGNENSTLTIALRTGVGMKKRGDRSLLGETLGSYYIKDRLGQGGMGAVYLARDMALERMVALKVLLPRFADDDEFVARFQREARASAKLNHPNIVQVYTVDVESDPPYMAMEYIEGEALESRIRRETRLPWQQALNVLAQVASALACAHEAGIIHRDIKPGNVLVDKKGRIRVTDFGIAKIIGSQTNLTGTQHTVGSPCYMSPEQCGMGEVVPASDLFSLGIMLFEMVTGTVPFKGDSGVAVMRKIVDESVPPLASEVEGVPPAVEEILQTLVARDLKLRYSSASQVIDDLKAYREGGTMNNLQSLSLKRVAQGPPSASAADLTRTPTGTGIALSDSLVTALLEDTTPRTKVPRVSRSFDIPWAGILITGALVILGYLAMVYYKDWIENRPPRPPQNVTNQQPEPIGEDGPGYQPPPDQQRPQDGTFRPHPPPREGQRGGPPPPRPGGGPRLGPDGRPLPPPPR